MSQLNKTLVFIGVAAVAVLAVFLTRPAELRTDNAGSVGELLFASFVDPFKATDLQILDFNQATGQMQPFEVKQVESKGRTLWSIPSHNNYPADAKDQVAQAASSVMGLKVLGMVGESQEDHELYGVVDPKKAKENSRGVGMRVTLRDKQGKDLAALIVGKEVPRQAGQRYVRVVDQNPVYVVAMKTDALSTRFDRWIEKSLLQISPWDMSKLWIRDHAVDEAMGQLIQRGELVLQYNDTGKPQWELLESRTLNAKGEWESVKLAADEELNTAKLDELKNALPELQIVDVVRKPEVFSADLKAKGDKSNLSKYRDILGEYGFHWANVGDGAELYSNNGEVRVLMKDGVEYILRFGDIAFDSAGGQAKEAKEGQDAKKDEKGGPGLNRYLFVMAQFNQNGIPKPEEKPLPGDQPAPGPAPTKDAAPAVTPPASEGAPAATPPAVAPAPADAPAPSETPKPTEENKPAPEEEKQPVDAKPTGYAGQNPAEDKPADAKPADNPPAPDKPADTKPADAPPTPDKAADQKPADAQPPAASNPPPGEAAKPAEGQPAAAAGNANENPIALPTDPKALEAAREQVEKENKRKREEYDEKVKAGKKRVEELNERFADWFYVISDDTYRKIHLGKDVLITKKPAEKKDEKAGQPGDALPGAPGVPPMMPTPPEK
jgi:hypothetical protein